MLRPFFFFYGGKWRIAKKYPTPKHDTIIEPFAGSAAYSVRYPEKKVILYDADPVVFGVWDYLIHVSEEEILNLPNGFDSVDDLSVPQEAKWLIGFLLNKGCMRPCKTPCAWMRDPRYSYQFWGPKIQNRIAAQIPRIRHWKIYNEDFQKVENRKATWFIDPPYSDKGKHYKINNIDYPVLGEWCRGREGQTIVCENDGANWLPFETLCEARSLREKSIGRSKEAMWYREDECLLDLSI